MESNVNIAQQDAFRDALAALGDPALTRVSEELQTSYRAMVAQIARLNAELEAARLARREETSKRERILTRLASLLDTLPVAC